MGDCGPMKDALKGGNVDEPLESIIGLKDILTSVVDVATTGASALAAFIEKAPEMIKNAFSVPTPLCFLTDVLLSQAPPAMTSLLDMVEKLKEIDLKPLLNMIANTKKSICGLDANTVKTPMAA